MPPAGFPGAGFPGGAADFSGGFPGRRRSWRRQQHTLLSLGMLLAQQVAGMERKPPLTLALAAGEGQPRSLPATRARRCDRRCIADAFTSILFHPHSLALLLLAVQVLFFLKPEGLEDVVPSIRKACLQPAAVLQGQWARLLWAPLLHADALHLYYNMSSFIWKVWGLGIL